MTGGASPHRVVIAGAGVAGLETLLTLHALAGDRVQVTVVDPRAQLELEARSVEPPFAMAGGRAYALDEICEDHGATLRTATLERVVGHPASIVTRAGDEIAYDSLVVAVGARRLPAFKDALTFRGGRDAELVHGLIQDVEGGYLRRLAFVVPPGVTWALPLYELALMTAERADGLCLDRLEITVVTPESRPLEVFGDDLADTVGRALADAGITLMPSTEVARVAAGMLFDAAGAELLHAQRVVALPVLSGPRIAGLPADEHGFIPADPYTRVEGLRRVYAIGDGTTQPIKQGGVGAQQAAVAAHQIAMNVGLDVTPVPFEPVLRAKLLTGSRPLYLRSQHGGEPGVAADHPLWWPPAKVVAPHLAAYLERRDHGDRGPAPAPAVAVVHAQGDPTGGVELLG